MCSLQCAAKRVSRRGDPARAKRGITRVRAGFLALRCEPHVWSVRPNKNRIVG